MLVACGGESNGNASLEDMSLIGLYWLLDVACNIVKSLSILRKMTGCNGQLIFKFGFIE